MASGVKLFYLVADSPYYLKVPWIFRVNLDFFPYTPDMNGNRVFGIVRRLIPDGLIYLLDGKHLSGVHDEKSEYPVFRRCQLDTLSIHADRFGGIVNFKNLSTGEQKSFDRNDLDSILSFIS